MILRFNWRESHHLYWGALVVVAGVLMQRYQLPPSDLGILVALIGAYLMADDLYQHWRQIKQPEYRSPVWKLWARINGV